MFNNEDLIKYIKDPGELGESTLKEIKELLDDYPYFQSAHLLYLKNLQNTGKQLELNSVLKKSALFIGDRAKLFYLLNPGEQEINQEEQQPGSTQPGYIEQETTDQVAEPGELDTAETARGEKEIEPGVTPGEETLKESTGSSLEFETNNEESNLPPKKENDILQLDDENLEGPVEVELEVVEKLPVDKDILELDMENSDGNDRQEKEDTLGDEDKKEKGEQEAQKEHDNLINSLSKEYGTYDLNRQFQDKDASFSNNLLDKFITENPKIVPNILGEDDKKEDISENSIKENNEIITEKLAKIYKRQKRYSKAIFTYEKLILKYPEKSVYFAEQIEKIKELTNK